MILLGVLISFDGFCLEMNALRLLVSLRAKVRSGASFLFLCPFYEMCHFPLQLGGIISLSGTTVLVLKFYSSLLL